jgi:hypothetical protein
MWGDAQLDDELRGWRQAREEYAEQQHARAETLAAKQERIRNARSPAGCERCNGALDGRKKLCAVCSRAEYWRRRLVVRPLAERRDACGVEKFEGYCRKCGLVEEHPRWCGAKMVCPRCARAYYARQQDRLERALRARLDEHYQRWSKGGFCYGKSPALSMITLGVSHSGNVADDRALLSAAWNRWRSWYQKKYKEKLCYAWVAECTDGRRKDGHAHLHVACLLPYRDYVELIDAWKRATAGQGRRIDVKSELQSPRAAAKYVAKYASKGTKTLCSPSLAASWVKAQHGRRQISTSYEFWAPEGPCAHAKMVLASDHQTWLTGIECKPCELSTEAKDGDPRGTQCRAPPVAPAAMT